MSRRMIVILVGVFALVLLSYVLWSQRQHPRNIVRTGSITVESRMTSGLKAIARTRTVQVGAVLLKEVELPNGNWVDCGGDCIAAFRDATHDLWDASERGKK